MDEKIKISKSFAIYDVQFNETALRLGIDNTITDETLIENARQLAINVLEPCVEKFGPLFITSWYRSANLEREYQRSAFARWCIKSKRPIREESWEDFLLDKQDHTQAQAVTIRALDNDALFKFISELPSFDVLIHKTHWISVSFGNSNQKRVIHE